MIVYDGEMDVGSVLKDRNPSEDLCSLLGIQKVADVVRHGRCGEVWQMW